MEAVGIKPINFWDDINSSIPVKIGDKNVLIPKRRPVAAGELKITQPRDSSGKSIVRADATIDGVEHGIEVAYDNGRYNDAVEQARADIERAVNLQLHEAAGGAGAWSPKGATPDTTKTYKGGVLKLNTPRPTMSTAVDSDALIAFADEMAAYVQAKTVAASGLVSLNLDAAEDRLRHAYGALLDDLAEHVAQRLYIGVK